VSGAILRSVLQALAVLLLMTVIVFFGLHMIGNPVDILIGQDVDQVDRLRIIQQLGLDQPIWRQYLAFLNGALHGNLGNSFVYNAPAIQLIFQRLPATLELAFAALIMAVLIGIPLGLLAGMFPQHPLSRLAMTGSILGFSLPTFWIGLMLIMAFSVTLGWLPSGGRGATASLFGVEWSWLTVDGLRHLILPALNLSLFKISLVMRLTRANVREVLPMDFVKFARQRLGAIARGADVCVAQYHDSTGDHPRSGVRFDHRVCGRDGKHLCLAGCRQTDSG